VLQLMFAKQTYFGSGLRLSEPIFAGWGAAGVDEQAGVPTGVGGGASGNAYWSSSLTKSRPTTSVLRCESGSPKGSQGTCFVMHLA
jgi:hypothetical protein